MANRKQIIETARTYVGTPFQHQARVKARGLDCVGLILCVADDLKINDTSGKPFNKFDYVDYGPQPSGGFVNEQCATRLVKVNRPPQPGDVVNLRVPVEPCHVAIISEHGGALYMIHAYNGGTHKCVEHVFDKAWQRRLVGVFEFPGIEE